MNLSIICLYCFICTAFQGILAPGISFHFNLPRLSLPSSVKTVNFRPLNTLEHDGVIDFVRRENGDQHGNTDGEDEDESTGKIENQADPNGVRLESQAAKGTLAVLVLGALFILALAIGSCFLRKYCGSLVISIDGERLHFRETLGRGHFTEVHLVALYDKKGRLHWFLSWLRAVCIFKCIHDNPKLVAAKILKPEIVEPEDVRDFRFRGLPTVTMDSAKCFVDELILYKIKHDNIVRMLGISKNYAVYTRIPNSDQSEITLTRAMILEYMNMGTCKNYIENIYRPQNRAAAQNIYRILRDVTKAFVYLNKIRVIHRDLKAVNVLVHLGEKMIAKVADFGLATEASYLSTDGYWACNVENNEQFYQPILAPEAKNGQFSSQSDVYAFGLLIGEIYALMSKKDQDTDKNEESTEATESLSTAVHPVEGRNLVVSTVIRIANHNYTSTSNRVNNSQTSQNSDIPLELQEIAQKCLEDNPKDRITFKHLSKVFSILIESPNRNYFSLDCLNVLRTAINCLPKNEKNERAESIDIFQNHVSHENAAFIEEQPGTELSSTSRTSMENSSGMEA